MKIALAQLNPTVGDIAGNRRLVQEAAEKATAEGADLVVLPEMVLTGYPPMDLLERDGFVNAQLEALEELAEASRDIAIVLGAVTRMPEGRPEALANSAVLLSGGQQVAVQPKSLLPTYDVFDEKRYFVPGDSWAPADLPGGGERLGLAVCEDTWTERIPYSVVPVQELASRGASIIINPSASPWHAGKPAERREMFEELVRHHGLPLVFVNQVGGNDELIFDGGSFVMNASGRIIAQMPLFETGLMVVDLDSADEAPGQPMAEEPGRIAQLEAGLVLGIRDYFLKQNLPPGAVIGLSGGIDSAVTAHLAVEALGPERVVGIAMPGPFSSEHSITDAVALAEMLEIELRTAEIEPMYAAYRGVFGSLFGKREDYGLTQQNIQSRIRGAILMAVSNEENRLVLATGNKSELSLGYCTLYGDTVGGLAVLGDVYKHDVYALARYANRAAQRIPTGSLEKPPSAELAPDQIDTNDLPDYDIVDAVLEQAIEGGRNSETIVPPDGCSREVALSVVQRLDRNEYKRRQTPLVLRTTPKAFGSGRRLPIVHRFG
jgi:NAD+ synthetase